MKIMWRAMDVNTPNKSSYNAHILYCTTTIEVTVAVINVYEYQFYTSNV